MKIGDHRERVNGDGEKEQVKLRFSLYFIIDSIQMQVQNLFCKKIQEQTTFQ